MAWITKYDKLSDSELLNQADRARNYSPLIEELCQRLAYYEGENSTACDINERADCPVCEATLRVDLDEQNNHYNLLEDDS